jgi:hypothetical protein
MPRRFDTTGDMLAIKPIPAIKNVIKIAVAILIAASVIVLWRPATITSPTPISILPTFPKIIGIDNSTSCFAYSLYSFILFIAVIIFKTLYLDS